MDPPTYPFEETSFMDGPKLFEYVLKDVSYWIAYNKVGYKEWVQTVERLREYCQWRPLTVMQLALIGKNHATFYSVNSLLMTHMKKTRNINYSAI